MSQSALSAIARFNRMQANYFSTKAMRKSGANKNLANENLSSRLASWFDRA
jgi:hypothetical protein